jgi:hypothetical protein
MRLAAGLVSAATIAALGAVPAHATARVPKVCNLVTDPPGDSTASTIPGDDSVDIVGGDFASNAKTITAIIKLKKFQQSDPQAPLGQSYFVLFSVKGIAETLTLSAGFYPTGTEYKFGHQGTDKLIPVLNVSYTDGDATGSVVGDTIHISADISKFAEAKKLKPGGQVMTISVEARRVYGQRVVPSQDVGPGRVPLGGLTLTYDTASGKKYTLGAPSCVAIGK